MADYFELMKLFVTTAECPSLAAAARKLGLSSASVSRGLADIETRLGSRLIERTTRALALTEQGRLFYGEAKRILADVAAAENALASQRQAPKGRLTVATPSLIGRFWLGPLVAEFLIAYPDLDLNVLLLDRPVHLIEEGIDAALHIGALKDSDLIAQKLGDIRMIVCASPSYIAQYGMPEQPDDLTQHRCLVFADVAAAPEWRFRAANGRNMSIIPPARLSTNALDLAVQAALDGCGFVRAPSWQIAAALKRGALVPVLESYERPPAPLHLIFTKARSHLTKLRVFRDFLADHRSF
jgi:DNA-binding transcriptional LysR family regulator